MELSNHHVLVTGGATGIGLGLAESFLNAGSSVIVCGRRKEALEEARKKHSGLVTFPCDLSQEGERVRLAQWISREHPRLDVLVNNAGIQQRMAIDQKDFWTLARQETAINWDAPVHLTWLLLDLLKKQPGAFILTVTSGLAFAPLAAAPIYSATKAALHSFTLVLRPLLRGTNIQVIEIVPPAVATDLGGPGLHANDTPLSEFIPAVVRQLTEGKQQVTHGFSEKMSTASPQELAQAFQRMNGPRT